MRRTVLIVLCVVLGMMATHAPGAEKAQRVDVTMKQMEFIPASITIQPGDTIVWTNNDDRDHSVAAADGSFKSGNISRGSAFEHQFSKAGTFSYTCSYHPRMKGVIIVKAQ